MRERLNLPAHLDGNVWRYGNLPAANKRHTHLELEVNLVTRGRGTYLLDNGRYQIRRGDLIWLFPAQEHVLIEQSADFQMWIAVFRRRAITQSATDATARALLKRELDRDCCRRLAHADLERLEALLAELSGESGEPGLLNAGLRFALLQAWRCYQRAADVPVADVHPAVESAARLIRDSTEVLSLDKLAHRVGLSSARLSRLFKEQTGFAMVHFRNRKLIERFLHIYGAGQRETMLAAALDAGFGSYPQFHRVFKNVMGCSPRDYQRSATR